MARANHFMFSHFYTSPPLAQGGVHSYFPPFVLAILRDRAWPKVTQNTSWLSRNLNPSPKSNSQTTTPDSKSVGLTWDYNQRPLAL